MNIRTTISTIVLVCACAYASAQTTVKYALPRSVLVFDVKAERICFHAGPYAKYAAKYLGFEAQEFDHTSYNVTSVTLKSKTEADQNCRFGIELTPAGRRDYFALTTQGLIAREGGQVPAGNVWRFPSGKDRGFSVEGLPANLTQETGH